MRDPRVAMPGDPDLDCHLTGLRLATITMSGTGEFDAEALLIFDTSQAAGWWVDPSTRERFVPDKVTELTLVFGVQIAPGFKFLANLMARRLRAWADTGVFVQMTSAPGKWTMLRSPTDEVPVPRTATPVRTEAVDG